MAVLAFTMGPRLRVRCWRRGLSVALLALLAVSGPRLSAQPVPSEYQVKAVFLFNFAQFVEWPAAGFPAPAAPFVIGVLGSDPFGAVLDDVVRDESVGAHKLVIQRYSRVEDIGACQILFIGGSETGRLEQAIAGLQNRAILTVSDAEGAATRGVMIRFLSDKGRIRLRINLDAAREAGLQISSKLLRRAEIVGKKDAP